MRRAAALLLVVAACGGDTAAPNTEVSTTAVTTTTTAIGSITTLGETTDTTAARVRPDGDAAPDFTVNLGEGGTLTLSEHPRPVYLLFWAEW